MKTSLRLLLSGIMLGGVLLLSDSAKAQINYSEDFETEDTGWSDNDFYLDDESPCAGGGAWAGFLYYDDFWGDSYASVTTSSEIINSNGMPATMTFKYKLLEWDGTAYPNSPDWGEIIVSYSSSLAGPWTPIETVSPDNHTASTSCATNTSTFTPMGGTIYLKIDAVPNTTGGYVEAYVFIDDISITQEPAPACSDTPDDSAAIAEFSFLCNGQEASVSLQPYYTPTGLSFQWQSSTDGENYDDIDGATTQSYEGSQDASTWYRAIITCDASEESVTSTPVQIVNTGIDCPCEIEFAYGVEPITLVQFAGIDNETASALGGNPMENYSSLEPAEVIMGETYDITLMGNTGGDYENYFTVYIDFNHNGDFSDDGESFPIGSIEFSTGTDGDILEGDIMIPEDVMEGITFMRVVKHYTYENPDYPASLENPCGEENTGYGQAEDYLINISAPPQPPVLDYYNLQWPGDATIAQGGSVTVYAQAWEDGVTPGAGAGEGVMAWIGVSTENTDPATWDDAVWMETTYNTSAEGNNDEFMLAIGSDLPVGTYYYAARWQLADGPYTYGGYVGAWGEEGVVNGVLTVNCAEIDVPDTEGTTQTFCGETEAGELDADANVEGGEIVWYDAETDGNMLGAEDELEDGMVYYVAQAVNGCESTRVGITVEITLTPEPDGSDTQVITVEDSSEATIEDLVVDATGTVNWYDNEEDAEDGENALEAGTVITAGTYYATQTIDGCESEPFAVTVDVLLGNEHFAAGTFAYYPNPVKDVLTLSYTEAITHVEVFNMLGQKVLEAAPGQNLAHVELSSLANAAYTVKVIAGGASQTIRIIKQ